jgi:hypothetical protein
MTCDGRSVAAIPDGSSNTLLFIEDAGRAYPTVGTFGATSRRKSNHLSPLHPIPGDGSGTGFRRVFAWVDPDAAANGVSGPNNATGSRVARINNYASPIGGPAGVCPWSLNNCGPNDEPFGFHSGVAIAAMGDGSVRSMRDAIDPLTLKWVSGADDGRVFNID